MSASMNLKTLFLGATALAFATNGIAQDRIYKKNGDVVEGKVKVVDGRNVTYKRADNAKGPDYTVNKNDIERVEYENGTEDVFSDRKRSRDDEDDDMEGREVRGHNHREHGKKERKKINYGADLITLSPANVTENGFGIGLGYEHNFGKRGTVSLYIPVTLSFGDMNGDMYYPGSGSSNNWDTYTNVAFSIGPKIYPGGSKGKVKYAIAPVLTLVTGERPYDYYAYSPYPYYSSYYPMRTNAQNFQFGGMIINSLNMNPSKHLYIGLELGWGFTFVNTLDNMDQDTREMAQFAFKLGYRF